MIRVANVTEKNIMPVAANPIPIAATISTEVLKNLADIQFACIEVAGRYIQNLTGSDLYYAFGQDCNQNSYHGLLQDKQQLDCSNHGAKVSVYSIAGGGTVAITILYRVDLVQQQTMVPSFKMP